MGNAGEVANLSGLEIVGAEHFHRFLVGVFHVIFRPPIYCVIIVIMILSLLLFDPLVWRLSLIRWSGWESGAVFCPSEFGRVGNS